MVYPLMKLCSKCGDRKPLGEFYASKTNADGLLGYCKSCRRAQVIARSRSNPAVQAYDRFRAKRPERKAHARQVTIKWRRENPEAYRAQTAVGNAIRDGRLAKGEVCEQEGCERTDVHAHHDDYTKPLEVRWMCPLHHHRHHAEELSA